ncbi:MULTISPECIES: hypothetical protein [unclassified Streptomyces]
MTTRLAADTSRAADPVGVPRRRTTAPLHEAAPAGGVTRAGRDRDGGEGR